LARLESKFDAVSSDDVSDSRAPGEAEASAVRVAGLQERLARLAGRFNEDSSEAGDAGDSGRASAANAAGLRERLSRLAGKFEASSGDGDDSEGDPKQRALRKRLARLGARFDAESGDESVGRGRFGWRRPRKRVLDPDTWKRFTPKDVDPGKCMARIKNLGKGGQCNKVVKPGEDFCEEHALPEAAVWLGDG
jgi:hypothetical protein